MELYHDFASHYDEIFPTNPITVHFLQREFEAGKLMDLGCATGGYVAALSRLGYQVTGLDLDPRMIKIGKEKHPDIASQLMVKNMITFDQTTVYQGVYCIGNTLVHLENEAAILRLFQRVFQSLNTGGKWIFQIVNYDRIDALHLDYLPTIEHNDRSFVRHYQRKEHHIIFHTILTYQQERYESNTVLLPLHHDFLCHTLQQVGFGNICVYGDFNASPYRPLESPSLIIVSEKRDSNEMD